jgi:hypothetical protein
MVVKLFMAITLAMGDEVVAPVTAGTIGPIFWLDVGSVPFTTDWRYVSSIHKSSDSCVSLLAHAVQFTGINVVDGGTVSLVFGKFVFKP